MNQNSSGDPQAAAEIASLPPAVAARILASLDRGWWWDETKNPFRGCTKVSRGCKNCWALADIERRLQHRVGGVYDGMIGPTFHPDVLPEYGRDLQPKRYFTPSVSDPFHESFTDEMVFAFFAAMNAAPWHYYFVVTKRPDRLAKLGPHLPWGNHIIAMVSVENEDQLVRIEQLHESGALRKGISFEPVVSRVPLRDHRSLMKGIDYAIPGGETGDKEEIARMHPEHLGEIIEVCTEMDVPLFFKQWGDINEFGEYVGRKKAGRVFEGRTFDALPRGCAEHLRHGVILAEAERIRRRTRCK